MFAITATLVHHTTDKEGISWDNTIQIPAFIVNNVQNEAAAIEVAKRIICPIDMQYESVTLTVSAVRMGN